MQALRAVVGQGSIRKSLSLARSSWSAEKVARLQAKQEAQRAAEQAAEPAPAEPEVEPEVEPTPADVLKEHGVSSAQLTDELGLAPLTAEILLTAPTVGVVEELIETHPAWSAMPLLAC